MTPTMFKCCCLDQRAIGKRLARLRKARGWRQVDLAERTGIHKSTIGAVELGYRLPTLQQAIGLAVCLKRSLESILYGRARNARLWEIDEGTQPVSGRRRDAGP